MATRSPFLTPRPLSALANLLTSRYRSQYVRVLLSPGSPSHISAALFRRPFFTCRSRQLYEALILPPTNHLAKGGFHSRTLSHFSNQSSSSANFDQNASGSLFASSYTRG